MSSDRQDSMEDTKVWINWNLKTLTQEWLEQPDDSSLSWEQHCAREIPYSDSDSAAMIFNNKNLKNRIHYLPNQGCWYVWNDVFHERMDGDLLAEWMCKTYANFHRRRLRSVKEYYDAQANALQGAAAQAKRDEYTKRLFKDHRAYRDRIHNTPGVSALITAIKREFSVEDSFFNDDRNWLVLQNGVIDLEDLRKNPPKGVTHLHEIRLLGHDPARPVYRAVNASLQPWTAAPRWKSFLEQSLPDADSRKFLAVLCGAAFLAESKTKIIPVLRGPKDSGKTVFIDTIHELAGGYGGQPNNTAIVRAQGANFEQDQFRGLRFVAISEPNVDRKVDDSFLKGFTGGDWLSTRTLHAKPISWKSQGVLFVASNSDLKFNTSDMSILDRFANVLFPHKFYAINEVPTGKEEYVKDQTLEETLYSELDGVLEWVLTGMLVFLQEGIKIPDVVFRERHRQYAEGSSAVAWLESEVKEDNTGYVIVGPEFTDTKRNFVTVGDAHLSYCSWCVTEYGEDPLTKRQFSKELQGYLDVDLVASNGMRVPRLIYRDIYEAIELGSS